MEKAWKQLVVFSRTKLGTVIICTVTILNHVASFVAPGHIEVISVMRRTDGGLDNRNCLS